jgi:hypothetical protein
VKGFAPSCTCTDCDVGFGGPNCAVCAAGYSGDDCTPGGCVATTNAADDGSDGNLYCINGGSIGGSAGSCTCTCTTGWFGPNCASDNTLTLSGGNTGSCAVDGSCFSSLSYTNSESCTFTVNSGGELQVTSFETEANYDTLTVGGVEYDGTNGPEGVIINAGETIEWFSDSSATRAGFEICIGSTCAASTNPSDDGSSGDFYCINGGSVGGSSGICTCTGCNLGFGGPNCAVCAAGYSGDDCGTADACVLTSTATDDGSDGNFYCINGGSVGGTTGSCTCTGCDTDFGGSSCEIAAGCQATSTSTDDGSDGNYYCINGGSVGGTKGACSSDCATGFGDANCASCAAGYSGASCSPDSCVATTTPTDDGSDGNFYCINGGSIGGTTGSCTCTCPDLWFGPSCNVQNVISLSGTNLGNCVVDANCFSSLSYINSEVCEFTPGVSGVLTIVSFETGENRQMARRKVPSDDDMENVGRASHTYSFPCLLPKLTLN